MEEVVWYVAYGSNLSRARLQEYLDRGPDPTPPRADRSLRIRRRLFFAGESRVWGGGRAYLDHLADTEPVTPARAWLLTRSQWADLHAQESGTDHRPGTDPGDLAAGEVRIVGPGRYDALLGFGRHAGVPVASFTGPTPLDRSTCTRPAVEYLRRIALGLREAHGWDVVAAATYLASRPGMAAHWDRDDLVAALRADTEAG